MNQSFRFPRELITPVTPEAFFSEYWEARPLHIARKNASHFADLLSLSEIETVLACQDFSFPTVQLTRAGQSVAVSDYTDENNSIVLPRVLQQHQQGATLVMSAAQNYLPKLGRLTRRVQTDLQLRSQTNVYLSPPGKQGFNAHFDNHDVFVLQVSGTKTFRFYAGGAELPFSVKGFDPDQCEIGSLEEEIQINAGDTLYIPRGIIHDAVADDQQSSLHITLGVHAVTVRNLLQEILQLASEKDVRYRRSVDDHLWHQTSSDRSVIKQQLQELLCSAFTDDNFNDALARLREDIALDTTPDVEGWLSDSRNKQISSDTVITVLADQILSTEKNNNTFTVRAAGQILQFDINMATAIERLLEQGQLVVQDLKGLNQDQKIALATRLYQEHLVDIDSNT